MKDEILKIVYDPKTGFNECAEELTALMCYREVRAFIQGVGIRGYGKGETFAIAFNYLKKVYSEETIQQAIEQVQKEQE
jgi:hypothetical protein